MSIVEQVHDYETADVTEQINLDSQKSDATEIGSHDVEAVTNGQFVEKTENNIQTVIRNDETDMNNESDWQKPISLKGFKKKLNEIFVTK